jgi:hypothetical protein
VVIGVNCEPFKKKVTFEECGACAQCLPAPIIKSLRRYDYQPERNVYYLREVIGCPRKAYFDRKSKPTDKYLRLHELYRWKRGEIFEDMADRSRWTQLDGSLKYKVDGEDVKLSARLDAYDPDTGTVIELKSVEFWTTNPKTKQMWKKKLPRDRDVLQVQGYGTIFRDIVPIKALRILYCDMNEYQQYMVELVDKADWLQERISTLHRAVRDSKPPTEERCYECRFCEDSTNCAVGQRMPLIGALAYGNRGQP